MGEKIPDLLVWWSHTQKQKIILSKLRKFIVWVHFCVWKVKTELSTQSDVILEQ